MPGLIGECGPPADARKAGIAPIHSVPQERIVAIEHPCIVRNFGNALKSLGGEPQVKHVLEHCVGDSMKNPEKPLEEPQVGVSLRPQDPYAKRLESTGVETRNVLVRVTLPTRTGRKRKRGTDEPFTSSGDRALKNDSITASELFSRLRDNPENYTIEPIGSLTEAHRFRSLPDFQFSARAHPTMRELGLHAFPQSHSALSKFHIPLDPGAAHIHEFPAPPSFTATPQPHLWQYTQAAGVRITQTETGTTTVNNYMAPPRRVVHSIDPDAPSVPTGPPADLIKHRPFGTHLDAAIVALTALLNERPLVTRRVAMNHIPHFSETVFKEATQWVGYSFRAGPFRDSLIRYGIDPRSDPKYRFYQTLMFQLDGMVAPAETQLPGSKKAQTKWNRTLRHVPDGWQSHVFDGEHVTLNGKTWQIVDVTDPLLAKLFATEDLALTCNMHSFGWYHNGTLCKARVIMRDKMECLFAGREPPHAAYEALAAFPEQITNERESNLYIEKTFPGSAKAVELALEIRNMARSGRKVQLTKDAERRAEEARKRGANLPGEGLEEGDVEEEERAGGAMGGALDPALMRQGDENMAGDFDDEEDGGEGENENDAEADLEAAGELLEEDGVVD